MESRTPVSLRLPGRRLHTEAGLAALYRYADRGQPLLAVFRQAAAPAAEHYDPRADSIDRILADARLALQLLPPDWHWRLDERAPCTQTRTTSQALLWD
jgi:hypothetical protein